MRSDRSPDSRDDAQAITTVYLDTSFFVWLEKATEEEADAVIADLNRLRIRHVVSHAILFELARHYGDDAREKRMLDRVERLPEPLPIPSSASWLLLRAEGDARRKLADFMCDADEQIARATAHGHAAERLTPQEGREWALQHGVPADALEPDSRDHPHWRNQFEQLTKMFAGIREMLQGDDSPEARGLLELLARVDEMTLRPPEEDPAQLQAMAQSILASPVLSGVRNERAMQASVTGNDRRILDVVTKSSPVAKVANALRDAGHMHVFLEHRERIDFLHLDHGRLNQVLDDAKHELRRAGVEHRCFAASSLADVVVKIEAVAVKVVAAFHC